MLIVRDPSSSFLVHNSIASFYVLLTVHLGIILVSDQLDAQFFFYIYMFISILYTFRATSCSSSGESIASSDDEHEVARNRCRGLK
jgi:hypothetical protein